MVVRELVALLGVKTDQASIKKAEGGLNSLIKKAGALAAAYVGMKGIQAFKSLIQEIATAADWMDKMAKRTGLSAQMLEGLGHAAQLSGGSLAAIESSIRKLQTAQVDADAGLATYTREFKRLGVEVRDSNGEFKDGQTLLIDIANGMQGLSSDAERSAVAMKLMGRQGTQLIPMLKEGGDAVRDMINELDELGGTMSQQMVDDGAEFIDNQLRMGVVLKSVKIAIAKDFIPWMNRGTEAFLEWWKANKDWIRSGIVNTLKSFGRIFQFVSDVVGGAVDLVMDLWGGLSKFDKTFIAIGAAVIILGKLIMSGPVGQILLLIALIALVIEDFQVWREGGKSAIGDLIAAIDEFFGIDLVGLIKEWGGYFIGTIQSMIETVLAFIDFFIQIFTEGPTEAIKNLVTMLTAIWGDWAEKFKGPIKAVGEFFYETFTAIGDWFQKNIVDRISKFFSTGIVGKIAGTVGGFLSGGVGGAIAGGLSAGAAQAKGRPGAGGSNVNQNLKMETTINAAPGMSEERIGREVEAGVSRALNQQNRDALKAFVPATESVAVGG